jgi:thymidylate synthase, flavin-dependent
MEVTLINFTPLSVPIHAMGKCYGKEVNEKILVNAVKAGHRSLLEHVLVTFDMTMSEKCLAQITRHRWLSFTVQSTRGADFSDMDYFDPSFFAESGNLNDKQSEMDLRFCLQDGISCYGAILESLKDEPRGKEIAGYTLPMGTNVNLTVSGNLRAWLEYLPKRLCKRASVEHQLIAREVYRQLNEVYPNIINKEVLGICENCKESSCDFSTHKSKPKEPVRSEL